MIISYLVKVTILHISCFLFAYINETPQQCYIGFIVHTYNTGGLNMSVHRAITVYW